MVPGAQVQTLNEQDWERAQQASVLANVAQAFESDADLSDGEDDGDPLFSSSALLSPSGQADAQTLAMMLQEQLDAINKEIRYTLARRWGRSLVGGTYGKQLIDVSRQPPKSITVSSGVRAAGPGVSVTCWSSPSDARAC